MSVHKSLRSTSNMTRARNVYNRWERLQKLKEQGRWKDGAPVYGLPKVRTTVIKIGGKKKAKAKVAEGAEGAEGAVAAAPGAKPAAGAAGAKPAAAAAPAKDAKKK